MEINRFNEDAKNYDRYRPQYCPALFQTILKTASLKPFDSVLEIGIGTGQASLPFLSQNVLLTALEPGNQLAALTRDKFRNFFNLFVYEQTFEQARLAESSFDLIYSATAFHWIKPDLAFPKAYRLLKPGKTLALFWNVPTPAKNEPKLAEAIQQLYSRYRPNNRPKPAGLAYGYAKDAMEKAGFIDCQCCCFESQRKFSAEEYIHLLNTYSDHRAMPSDTKTAFEQELREILERWEKPLIVYDTIELYTGKKDC